MRPEYDFSAGERGRHYKVLLCGPQRSDRKADGTVEEHPFGQAEGVVCSILTS